MRNRLLFFGVVLAVFGGINYYIGLRGWQWLGAAAPGLALGWVYWVLFAFVSSAFLVARFAGSALPRPVADWLARAGSYWLVAFLYLLPLLLVIDLVRAVTGLSGAALVPVGFALVGGLVVLVAYGAWRARNVVVVRHEIAVAKPGGKHKELHVVLVSDTHLGAINGLPRLQAMVGMVNALEPDLVLLAGDICDDDFAPFVALDMASGLAKLRAKLGVYSVLGNHEYIAGHIAEYRREMARAGIRVLVDEAVLVDDSFYVIGRDDISAGGFGGRRRAGLPAVLESVDRSRPLVLMDHQPYRLEEAEQAGIDLQVSGHTHRGQMFPNHLITRRIFEVDWGYLKKGALHVIVSLGFGTWGPPVRIGNRPEVVSIRVRFEG